MRVQVTGWEEEWRTTTRRSQRQRGRRCVSYGRACLWLRLACGHHEQRMVRLDESGNFTPPASARCGQCSETSKGE